MLKGVQVVVDVSNSPSFEDKPALKFFETSGRNLLAAEKTAGVKHQVALPVVGTDRLTCGPSSLEWLLPREDDAGKSNQSDCRTWKLVHPALRHHIPISVVQVKQPGKGVRPCETERRRGL